MDLKTQEEMKWSNVASASTVAVADGDVTITMHKYGGTDRVPNCDCSSGDVETTNSRVSAPCEKKSIVFQCLTFVAVLVAFLHISLCAHKYHSDEGSNNGIVVPTHLFEESVLNAVVGLSDDDSPLNATAILLSSKSSATRVLQQQNNSNKKCTALEDVKLHNNRSDCWIIFYNQMYVSCSRNNMCTEGFPFLSYN